VNSGQSDTSDWRCAAPFEPPKTRAAAGTAHGRLAAVAARIGETTPMPLRFAALCRSKRLRTRYAVIAMGVLLVVMQGASTTFSLSRSYHRTLDGAAAALDSIAGSAAMGTAHLLLEIDNMLVSVERIVATASTHEPLDALPLNTALPIFHNVSDILILDEKGRLARRANPSARPMRDYAAAPYFTAHRSGAPERLFIGAPEPGNAPGSWSIMMSRQLSRDGIRLGVIVAEVPIGIFADFYRAIAPTRDTSIALRREDGALIIAQPSRGAAVRRVPLAAAAGSAAFSAFHRVAGAPWIVSASRSRGQVLHAWHRECAISLLGFSLFAATVAALAKIAIGALGRSQLAIARLRRTAAGLKREIALLQTTLENIGEGLSVFDRQGRLVACNRRFKGLLDLPPNLPILTTLSDVLMFQAVRGDFGDLEPGAETARRLERFYKEVPVTKERVTLAGRTLQIQRRAMPDGAVLSVYSDVTEIKESELKTLRARRQAESANRSKSEFLANMSHELRTPLNAIIGFSEIISNELFGPLDNPRYLEYIKDILASSLHLLSIINDVLDMSKIEAGKLELAKEAVTLQVIIGDVLRMMRERAQIRGISLAPRVVPDDIVMWADERALIQILLNLLSNAIKFSKDGGTVMIRLAAARGGCAVIEIEDHGIGMTAEEQQRAVQPFGQAKPVIAREYGGTGLGLPISKGLVEAHGGTLTIRSELGSGTIVRILLPIDASRSRAGVESLVTADAADSERSNAARPSRPSA
jgi:signal transduction histidine kinase